MAKKIFGILTDSEIAEENGELIDKIKKSIEEADCEVRILPRINNMTSESAMDAFKNFEVDAYIFAGAFGRKESVSELRQKSIEALSEEERHELEQVVEILDNNLLNYYFQPIVSAETGHIFAFEALMRARKYADSINPVKILKYSEILGRLGDVERLTFLNVAELIDENLDFIKDRLIFINSIPGARLLPDDYVDIESALIDHAQNVVVEITEQTEADEATLRAIKRRYELIGIGLALDDYGTGYSNVMNLLQYMPSYVKIDRSLLQEIDKYPKKQRFVKELIDFCKDNNILSLAEGVETWRELRMVVRMGVDLIQGYYTAHPSPNIIREIDSDIRREILRYRDEYNVGKKQPVYIADDTGRVNLSSISKSNYSCILIGKDERESNDITVSGTHNLKTKAHVEIYASYKGKLTLENAHLSCAQGKSCVELGENCDVTLVLIGDNRFDKGGIMVPESSKLTIIGPGNLNIALDGQSTYGIGNNLESGNGELIFNQDGFIDIDVKGNSGVAIGSGNGGNIRINKGKYNLIVNCGYGVGIGSHYNDISVDIEESEIEIALAVTKGVGIGSIKSNCDVKTKNASIKCNCEGTEVSCIGSIEGDKADIEFSDASIYLDIRGDYIVGAGSVKGGTNYNQDRATLRVKGSGSHALAYGGLSSNTMIHISDSDTSVDLMTACQKDTMAPEENIIIKHGKNRFSINGYPYFHNVDYGEYR
ncbi:MAG: EAL domain-containing protein [Lachnospiraceae bacterium]|nr:EAL domain-containing protein [Lachnospiraceae bacterium]